jgi:hypothetical protein
MGKWKQQLIFLLFYPVDYPQAHRNFKYVIFILIYQLTISFNHSLIHCNFKYVIFILICQLTISFIHSAIPSVAPLTTGPSFLPKRVLNTVRSSTCPINYKYPLFSLRSPNSCLVLLRLPVPSILSSVLSSIMCFR